LSSALDPDREALLSALVHHEVRFVLIGGAAIQSPCGRYDTQDIDVTPDAEKTNLQRLCDALNELECRLVTEPATPAEFKTCSLQGLRRSGRRKSNPRPSAWEPTRGRLSALIASD
jgi:hypothetical protein